MRAWRRLEALVVVPLLVGCAARGGHDEASLRRDTLGEAAGYEARPAAADETPMARDTASGDQAAEPGAADRSLLEIARRSGVYATFLQAVEAAGWHDRLSGGGDFTVLAPTDAAFAALPPERLAAVLNDRLRLERLVAAHVVRGRHSLGALAEMRTVRTAGGLRLTPRWTADEQLFLDGAEVVEPDRAARNGVLHGVDAVLAAPEGRR
jgi:uncharacterized surface protein with fasciclin (FAS1) repeats